MRSAAKHLDLAGLVPLSDAEMTTVAGGGWFGDLVDGVRSGWSWFWDHAAIIIYV